MASGESGAPRTHSFVAGFRYPERNRRGPLVINPLLPNRESPVSDLASRPARKDGEKTRFSPHHIVLRSLNTAAQSTYGRHGPGQVAARRDRRQQFYWGICIRHASISLKIGAVRIMFGKQCSASSWGARQCVTSISLGRR